MNICSHPGRARRAQDRYHGVVDGVAASVPEQPKAASWSFVNACETGTAACRPAISA